MTVAGVREAGVDRKDGGRAQCDMGADVPNPTTGLTLRHRTAMVRTWDLVRPDLKTHGIYFFLRLFREEPQLKTRFKGFMNKTEDQLRENKRLAAHGTTVLTAITSMVDNLDDVGVLVELLQTTGLLAPVLLNYLRDNLGSAWTSVADEAWAKALKVIMSVIVSGYDITEPNQS
ncbi:Globin-like [Homarus americanus]|uniref:Globin-like n=1 Tax=Homarus americanus TaxID=6706 RepID=A0A8J5JUL0_HOMAM|nr:Globin-like [Homarus americanus]